ncbi:carbon starvation protein A, partial [bacterium]|nr:carbon starvation protein A [bacterium]
MVTFIIGIIILLLGYVFYSSFVDRIFEPDDRLTPANKNKDNVDYIPMSKNRNSL